MVCKRKTNRQCFAARKGIVIASAQVFERKRSSSDGMTRSSVVCETDFLCASARMGNRAAIGGANSLSILPQRTGQKRWRSWFPARAPRGKGVWIDAQIDRAGFSIYGDRVAVAHECNRPAHCRFWADMPNAEASCRA